MRYRWHRARAIWLNGIEKKQMKNEEKVAGVSSATAKIIERKAARHSSMYHSVWRNKQ